MNLLEQLRDLLGIDTTPAPTPRADAVRAALEAGQRAKRAEDYPQALEAFNQALRLVEEKRDLMGMGVIALQKAEVLIYQKQWDEAEALLSTVRQRAQYSNHKAQTAYTLDMFGMLAQAQGDWARARQHYEQALNVSRSVGALGAEARALGHLGDTYLHENNASYAAHLLREALPKLNAAGDVEWSSYFVGLAGQALIETGQEIEGNQLLQRALRLAKQLNDRRYERHWSLVMGARALEAGHYQDARSYYEAALGLFDAMPTTKTYVSALCQMSMACLKVGEREEALRYARQAQDLSAGIEDDELRTQAQGALGIALHADGLSEEAIPFLEAAAEGYQRSGGSAHGIRGIEILRNLAAAQADTNRDDRAISTYQQAAEQAEKQGTRLELAEAHRDLGLLYAQRRRLQEAIQSWTTALAIYEAEKAQSQIARLHCDIGGARKQLGQGQRALKEYEQALMALNMLHDDPDTRGLVLSNAANAYVDQGDIESADAFFQEAITLAQRAGNEAAEATRRGNYGWFLISIGRPRQAIASLEQALRLSQMLKLDLQTAVQNDNLGLAYEAMGDHSKALGYHERALELVRRLQNAHWEPIFKANLANTLLALERVDEAETFADEALFQSRSSQHIEAMVQALTLTARVRLAQERPADAETLLNEAVTLARRADLRRLLAEALHAQSQQQAAVGNIERAQSLWEEARKLFSILQSPKAKIQPAWLTDTPVGAG